MGGVRDASNAICHRCPCGIGNTQRTTRVHDRGPADYIDEMVERRDHWENIYASRGEDEVSWFQKNPSCSLDIIAQIGIDKAAPIIDIGGGTSRLIDALIDRGYTDTSVLDISKRAISVTRERLGRFQDSVDWIVDDVTEWVPRRRYALWHDRAVLHFLTDEADRTSYRNALANGLSKNGNVVIATFGPDGPQQCSGLPVVRYDKDAIEDVFDGLLRLEGSSSEDHTTPSGAHQAFIFYRFTRDVGG